MKLYCYHIPPIDFWTGAMTRSQLLSSLCSEISNVDGGFDDRQKWSSPTGWDDMIRACTMIGKLVDHLPRLDGRTTTRAGRITSRCPQITKWCLDT